MGKTTAIFCFSKKELFSQYFFSKKTHPSHGLMMLYFEMLNLCVSFKTIVPNDLYVNSTVYPMFYLTLHFITSIS